MVEAPNRSIQDLSDHGASEGPGRIHSGSGVRNESDNVWTGKFLNPAKKARIKKYPDTCGRGLSYYQTDKRIHAVYLVKLSNALITLSKYSHT